METITMEGVLTTEGVLTMEQVLTTEGVHPMQEVLTTEGVLLITDDSRFVTALLTLNELKRW